MGMSVSKPYRFIVLSEDIEEVKKMREYNNQVIPDKSTAIAVDTNEQFIFQDGKWRKMTFKMTIGEAEALEILNDIGLNANYMLNRESRTGMACELAIDIIQKYQKIKEIVTNNDLEWGNTSVRANALWEVKKVIEDGNDTTNTGSN